MLLSPRHLMRLRMQVAHPCPQGRRLSSQMSPVRVRFAPSPTGSLHIGGVRTALFNWLLARKTNGAFIVRVEDTDTNRSSRSSEESILNDLQWMNLNWDEGPRVEGPCAPYRQSERLSIYQSTADQLVREGKAYRCFYSEEELAERKASAKAKQHVDSTINSSADDTDAEREAGSFPSTPTTKYCGQWRDAAPSEIQAKLDAGTPYTIRFKVLPNKTVSIDDQVRGRVTWDVDSSPLDDFVLVRSSGVPVYNFCVAVDDALMRITHVLRAEEHLSNTLKQLLILEALGHPKPSYGHCSLILGTDKQKLSKRHGAMSVTEFAALGFIPDAMMNYLANLGWNDGTPKEIYTPSELIAAFEMERIVKGSAVFDMDKLRWVNAQHLKLMPDSELEQKIRASFLDDTSSDSLVFVDCGTAIPELKSEVATRKSKDGEVNQMTVFVRQALKIARKDLQVVHDVRSIAKKCMSYDIVSELNATPSAAAAVIAGVGSQKFMEVIQRLVSDFDRGVMPLPISSVSGSSDQNNSYADTWNAYVKSIGASLHLKGKELFHPVRLAMTGRTSGPDVGEQIVLWEAGKSIVQSHPLCHNPGDACKYMRLVDRIAVLRSINLPTVQRAVQSTRTDSISA